MTGWTHEGAVSKRYRIIFELMPYKEILEVNKSFWMYFNAFGQNLRAIHNSMGLTAFPNIILLTSFVSI